MDFDKTRQDNSFWSLTLRQGRCLIQQASQDAVIQEALYSIISPPGTITFTPPRDDIRLALKSLPAYCNPTATSIRCASQTETHGLSFLGNFPPEIRNAIYKYTAVYPRARKLFDAYYSQYNRFKIRNPDGKPSDFAIKFYTPNILLLNKQITREAMTVLRSGPLVIDRVPPWIMGHRSPLPFTDFMSECTLQSLQFVEIKLSLGDGRGGTSGGVWLQILEPFLRVWSEKNSLVRLKVMIKVNNVANGVSDKELRNYELIVRKVDQFAFKHGAKHNTVQFEQWVVDRHYAFNHGPGGLEIRKYPDPYIWQGSVLEWV
ncbi:hypothetical protein GGR50DRAFT_693896 [Xylaria sp. CBS 124048]|nr:hypothetical protein GGR50DRAFT_693896 [Xylaria sp. CBS 124048]